MAERTKDWMILFGLKYWRSSAGNTSTLYNMEKRLSEMESPLFAKLSKKALPHRQIALS